MTDNRTTELQKKLKEAGVKYTYRTQGCKTYTNWGEPMVNGAQFIDGGDWTELTVENATPEQAIAATLGSETVIHDWEADKDIDTQNRWHELFGTPERAAQTLYEFASYTSCRNCSFSGICGDEGVGCIYERNHDVLLEWLRGDV